jgi:cold shock protein
VQTQFVSTPTVRLFPKHRGGCSSLSQHKGQVVWFNNAKGFGFLKSDGAPDVFCHYIAIDGDGYKTLKEGELVEYEIIQGTQGLQAEHVKRIRES